MTPIIITPGVFTPIQVRCKQKTVCCSIRFRFRFFQSIKQHVGSLSMPESSSRTQQDEKL